MKILYNQKLSFATKTYKINFQKEYLLTTDTAQRHCNIQYSKYNPNVQVLERRARFKIGEHRIIGRIIGVVGEIHRKFIHDCRLFINFP